MNKKETTQNIEDFIKFNAYDIADLYKNEPVIASVFEKVLNALSDEYGSGADYTVQLQETKNLTIPEKPATKQRPPQTWDELKAGDRVYLPKSKLGEELDYSALEDLRAASGILWDAVNKNQEYVYITRIERNDTAVLDYELSSTGDFFKLSELVPYPGNVRIGDVIVEPKTGYRIVVEDVKTYNVASGSYQDTLVVKNLASGETNFLDAPTIRDNIDTGVLVLEPQNDISVEDIVEVKHTSKQKEIIDWKAQRDIFMKTGYVKDLSPELKKLAFANQVEQGNAENGLIELTYGRIDGNFTWDESFEAEIDGEFWKNINEGEWEIYYDDPSKWASRTASTPKGSFKANIETIPALLDYAVMLDFNIGGGTRKSPTQSAGELYRTYGSDPVVSDMLITTFFKGNDDSWYELVERKGTWVWKKASPQPSIGKRDYQSLSDKELRKLLTDTSEAMTGMDTTDPEYDELNNQLEDIKNQLAYNKTKKSK